MALIKQRPVLSYFVLTFAISQGAILVLITLNGMPVTVAEAQAQLPVMIVMHFSLTACSIAFSPTSMSGWQVFAYSLSVAAAMWLLAAVVAAVNWKQFSQR